MPKNQFEIEVFYDKSGMNYIKNINQVKNKNIIDAGGFIGDSAIVFSDYTDKNVYSFEPFLKGAIETIKEQKPVLIISIYHNYSDFFEIKPMIENLNLGYKFRIIRNKSPQLITETKLLAEVY